MREEQQPMTTAILHTLALLAARWAVRAEALAHGIKLRDITAAQLTYAARLYLDQHYTEMMQKAAEAIFRSPRLMRMAIREYRERQRRAKARLANIKSHAQRQQRCETSTIPVQISGAK
jgi:hypothetical protein